MERYLNERMSTEVGIKGNPSGPCVQTKDPSNIQVMAAPRCSAMFLSTFIVVFVFNHVPSVCSGSSGTSQCYPAPTCSTEHVTKCFGAYLPAESGTSTVRSKQ